VGRQPVQKDQAIAKSVKVPPSIKGWVENESIATMPPDTAFELINWFPDPDALRLRNGSQLWATCGAETLGVGTVFSWLGGGSNKLLAACNGKIYDVTVGGASSTVGGGTGFANDDWQYVNFTSGAGTQILAMVNGHDAAQQYNGTAVASMGVTGNTNALTNVFSFNESLFFCENNTANVWWLNTGVITGAMNSLALGPYLTKGGTIIGGAQWTFSTGFSIVNLCVFVSSEGEILVFSGTNPGATNWSKLGQFTIGRPVGFRCLLPINSDLIILCEDGLMPMSKAMQFDRAAAARASFTFNIQKAFMDQYQLNGGLFGWQILTYAKSNFALINIPQGNSMSYQYVMNVITGAWAQFQGMNGNCWCVQRDSLYYGAYANGQVYGADTGSGDGTNAINATWVAAFNDCGAPGMLKEAKAIQLVIETQENVSPSVGVSADYAIVTPAAVSTYNTPGSSLWDVALWDVGVWGNPNPILQQWEAATGVGYQLAPTVTIASLGPVPSSNLLLKIEAAYMLFEIGSPL
jgi:hypothetical protein